MLSATQARTTVTTSSPKNFTLSVQFLPFARIAVWCKLRWSNTQKVLFQIKYLKIDLKNSSCGSYQIKTSHVLLIMWCNTEILNRRSSNILLSLLCFLFISALYVGAKFKRQIGGRKICDKFVLRTNRYRKSKISQNIWLMQHSIMLKKQLMNIERMYCVQ